MFKKFEPISIITVFFTATLVFFLPYIIETIKRNNKDCDYNLLEEKMCQSKLYAKK